MSANRKVKSSRTRKGMSRRKFVGTTAGAVAAGTIVSGFPNIVSAAESLRTVGLGVSIINEIQGRASKDTGIKIRGQALGYGAMFGKMLNQNDQYEVAEGYYNDMDVFIPSKVWQPIDTKRIKDWDKVTNLSKTGILTPGSKPGQGDAPFRHLWLDKDGNRVKGPSRYISMVPGWHNADSIGYNPEETGGPIESWADLMSDKFKGRVALLNVQQSNNFIESVFFGLGAAGGFALVLVMFAASRERIDAADIPAPFRGTAIALMTAGIMSLAFMGFVGMARP